MYNLILSMLVCMLVVSNFNIPSLISNPTVAKAATETNLITTNPSFDQGINQGWTTSQSATMSASTDHAPGGSIASLKISSKHVVYSEPITVNQQDYFELSTYVKGAKGGETAKFGWQEFDVNGKSVSDDALIFVSGTKVLTNNWIQYKAIAKVQYKETTKIKIIFYSSTDGGVVYWDDFSLIAFSAPDLGCQNNSVSKCAKYSAGSSAYHETKTNSVTKSIEIKIPVDANFNADNSDMIVETRYQDVFNYSKYYITGQSFGAVISNFSPWFSDDGSYFTQGFASLGLYGNQAWQTDQSLFLNSKDDPKALVPVGGYYQFKITLPTLTLKDDDSAPSLPIDFISVTKVNSAQKKALLDFQKRTRSMKEAYLADNNPVPTVAGDLTWFSSPSMELVLPYSKPSAQDSVKQPLSAFSAVGEVEPVNFSIYAKNNLKNLQFDLGAFTSSGVSIAPANLKIEKVFYEERQWIDSKKGNTYGLLPDRLEDYVGADLPASTTQQFYLMVTLPKDQPGGTYTGKIDIKVSGAKIESIPVTIEVLPIVLDNSTHINAISRNPYSDSTALTSKYADLVVQNMVSHDMDSIIGSVGTITPMTGDGNSAKPFHFDISSFNDTFKKTYQKGANQKIAMFQGLSNVANTIIHSLQSRQDLNFTKRPELYDQLTDSLFVNAMNELISELKQSVDSFNIQNKANVTLVLETTDEPNDNLNLRIFEDRIDRIVREKGIKTFTTYQPSADSEVICSVTNLCGSFINGKISALAPLIDYKIYHLSDAGVVGGGGIIQGSDGFYNTYYSQLRNPVYNRFMSGFYAEKLNTQIIYNWVYFDNGGGDSYDDFDISANRTFPTTAYDFVLAYPTWEGKINSSTSLEAMREGAKDSKYYATLQNLISKRLQSNANDTLAKDAQQYLTTLLTNVGANWANDYANKKNDYGFGSEIIKSLSGGKPDDYAVFDRIRKNIFDRIKALAEISSKITISSDKKYVMSGEEITYNLLYKNTNDEAIANVSMTVPVNGSLDFVSATDGGQYDSANRRIVWTIPSIVKGAEFKASFVAKVK